jgi:hypothetical protein
MNIQRRLGRVEAWPGQFFKVPSCGGYFAGIRLQERQEEYFLSVSFVAELLESAWVGALRGIEMNE